MQKNWGWGEVGWDGKVRAATAAAPGQDGRTLQPFEHQATLTAEGLEADSGIRNTAKELLGVSNRRKTLTCTRYRDSFSVFN